MMRRQTAAILLASFPPGSVRPDAALPASMQLARCLLAPLRLASTVLPTLLLAPIRLRFGLVACVLLAASPCAAADDPHPRLRPLRDVDVTYVLDAGDGATLHERLRWSVTAQTLRVDPPTPDLYVIIDLAARRMSTVRTAERAVIETAAPDNVTGMPDSAGLAAVRQGEDTVAGLPCTQWDMTDAAGEPARLCLTADGVLLRASAGGRTLLSAETVRYGALDAALFAVPGAYARKRLSSPPPAAPPPASPPRKPGP